jgi:glycosyltransferase involved in cell wall biosynthesis
MPKIVILSTRYDLGGASLLATQVAARLRERGHEAEAWCLYFHSERHAPPDEWVRILHPREPHGVRDLIKITNALRAAMRKFGPDTFFGVQPLANVLGALTAAMTSCPRRFGGQHNPADSQRRTLRTLEKVVGTLVYTGNIAVSEAVRATYFDYPARYRRKLKVIRNGIPGRGEKRPQVEARDHFGLPPGCFLVGTIGQHDTDQKHHDFLIDLLPLVPDVHVAIAGDGRRHGHLQERIAAYGVADRAHLLGAIPQRSVESFLDSLDVFVLPSRFEGFSLALLEAMQSGLPIIGNDIATIREALCAPDQQYGFLVPTDRPEKWREAIIALKDDPPSRVLWSKRAAEGAQLFSLEKMIGAYEQACL